MAIEKSLMLTTAPIVTIGCVMRSTVFLRSDLASAAVLSVAILIKQTSVCIVASERC